MSYFYILIWFLVYERNWMFWSLIGPGANRPKKWEKLSLPKLFFGVHNVQGNLSHMPCSLVRFSYFWGGESEFWCFFQIFGFLLSPEKSPKNEVKVIFSALTGQPHHRYVIRYELFLHLDLIFGLWEKFDFLIPNRSRG